MIRLLLLLYFYIDMLLLLCAEIVLAASITCVGIAERRGIIVVIVVRIAEWCGVLLSGHGSAQVRVGVVLMRVSSRLASAAVVEILLLMTACVVCQRPRECVALFVAAELVVVIGVDWQELTIVACLFN